MRKKSKNSDQTSLNNKAVALSYQPSVTDAPVVTAKGQGKTAERIIETAALHNIPIHEDASLVEILSQLNLEEQIPVELYQVIAEIMSAVYHADQAAALAKEDAYESH